MQQTIAWNLIMDPEFSDQISDYFEGVAAKYLSVVDSDPARSHQHEIGGLPKAGFRDWLGSPGKNEEYRFPVKQVYIRDEEDAPVICESEVTWYDSRRNVPHRSPEYRLYYYDSPVTGLLCPGDFFLIAKLKDGSLLMVFTPAYSTTENQLRTIFGLSHVDTSFRAGSVDAIDLLLPLRMMLEELGIEVGRPSEKDDFWLKQLIRHFGGNEFPSTSQFSKFARDTTEPAPDPIARPDDALMAWMGHEEKLFRIYERHLVKEKLQQGFGSDGSDVDDFISFSLSVQNRRKSRVGHAFESHLNFLFESNELKFEQGRGKEKFTENNSKPDFLFPSFAAYKSEDFDKSKLTMLGAKTTCKDRWRQVLSEAAKIPSKHLVTLEPAISESQTKEMAAHGLTLVIPSSVHITYSENQRSSLMSVANFIKYVREQQTLAINGKG